MLIQVAIRLSRQRVNAGNSSQGIESRYGMDDGHTGLTKSMLSNAGSDSINSMMVKESSESDSCFPWWADPDIWSRASVAAVVSEAAAIIQGSLAREF